MLIRTCTSPEHKTEAEATTYDLARRAGMSAESAAAFVKPAEKDGYARSSDAQWGGWEAHGPGGHLRVDAPPRSTAVPELTHEAVAWLNKVGLTLQSQWIAPRMQSRGLPVVIASRVRIGDSFGSCTGRDGYLRLDVRTYTPSPIEGAGRTRDRVIAIPVEAALHHDLRGVIERVLREIGGAANARYFTEAALNETDLSHVG